jgi:UDP-N-acetylmuramate dehydrogenase
MVLDETDPNGRSCGSFFVNPIVDDATLQRVRGMTETGSIPAYAQPNGSHKLSAAWLIERSGLRKGERHGNVGLSSRHALAIVCHDGATANDVRAFAEHVRARVAERFGIRLTPEPELWRSRNDAS